MRDVVWAIGAGAATVVGLLFCLHWQRSRDRFFLYFAVAFWSLATSTMILLTTSRAGEDRASAYLVRFLAFLLIIVAIVDKNRPRREHAKDGSELLKGEPEDPVQ